MRHAGGQQIRLLERSAKLLWWLRRDGIYGSG